MVASNPLFKGGITLKKFNATVINDVWPEVIFFTAVAASASRSAIPDFLELTGRPPVVALVTDMTTHSLSVPSTLLGVLGTVLGLVISFRTSSAYERYLLTERSSGWN
jgi:hypothetical protein